MTEQQKLLEVFDYRRLLGAQRKRTLGFSEFVDSFLANPGDYMKTSAALIDEAIKYFGYEIVVRGGEPILSYKIFKDLFSNGVNAVYGQEACIKHIVDVIGSVDKEAGPKRGIVLFGPPASGKTNIVDLISQAVEEYTKENTLKLYSFCFRFAGDHGRVVEVRSAFAHHPILLFPLTLQLEDGTIIRPRQQLLDELNCGKRTYHHTPIPTYYRYASLDKRSLDILETLSQNPRNEGKSLFEIIEEYVRVEEIEFSNAQGKGIANIDDMKQLAVRVNPVNLGPDDMAILNAHLPGKFLFHYEGAMISSNRGILHIHDAFGAHGSGGPSEVDYKPLLMLLGSGKISLESTQVSLDTTAVMTTNLEEIDLLDSQLTSAKLLDRIVRVPVNYLLDAVSEMDILTRDMANLNDKYDVDPNLMRVAAYFSVMTRLKPPEGLGLPNPWTAAKKRLYQRITPEQKLMVYCSQTEDPINTIRRLPHWHPFRNECLRNGINIFEPDCYIDLIVRHPEAMSLSDCGLFTNEELKLIDDQFMRQLGSEHYPLEGREGISIRQLQNVMRNTIASSNGTKVTVDIFLRQLDRLISEGPSVHHWLATEQTETDGARRIHRRSVGTITLAEGVGDYSDFKGLVQVTKGLYHLIIQNEITVATVDRDPERIQHDLRRYLQQVLLAKAVDNQAFSHILIPKYSYIDPDSGEKVEEADPEYLKSIEDVIAHDRDPDAFRKEVAQKFFDAQDSGELSLEPQKTIINSRDDNVLNCFSKEYRAMLSHRKVVDDISPEMLRDAFFHKRNSPDKYAKSKGEVRQLCEQIIRNMCDRFRYSKDIALDTIIYALRSNVINFSEIIS